MPERYKNSRWRHHHRRHHHHLHLHGHRMEPNEPLWRSSSSHLPGCSQSTPSLLQPLYKSKTNANRVVFHVGTGIGIANDTRPNSERIHGLHTHAQIHVHTHTLMHTKVAIMHSIACGEHQQQRERTTVMWALIGPVVLGQGRDPSSVPSTHGVQASALSVA